MSTSSGDTTTVYPDWFGLVITTVILTVLATLFAQKCYSAVCQWWKSRCAREIIWVAPTGSRAHLKATCDTLKNSKPEKIYVHPKVVNLLLWCNTCNPVMANRFSKSGSAPMLTQRRLAHLDERTEAEEGQSTLS